MLFIDMNPEQDQIAEKIENDDAQEYVLDAYMQYLETKDEDQYFWSYMFLNELCSEKPEVLWQITLKFCEKYNSDHPAYGAMGAGHLENLLTWHGSQFIDRVELEAKRSPRFRKLLNEVWMGDENKDVTKRVEFWQKAIPKDE